MPENKTAFRVVQFVVPGLSWQKGKDSIYRPSVKPAEIAQVMQGMAIENASVFESVVSCLTSIELEHL